jgi:hypothetical protein
MWPNPHIQLLNAPAGPLSPADRAAYLDQYVVIARVTWAKPVSAAVIEGLGALATQCHQLSSLESYSSEIRTQASCLAEELLNLVAEASEACGQAVPLGLAGSETTGEVRVLDLDGRCVLGRYLAETDAVAETCAHPVVERARRLVCRLELLRVWVEGAGAEEA